MVHKQEGCLLYVCTKFESDCSICSKVIKGSQNFEIRSRDLGHVHFGVVLWSRRSSGLYSMSVQNLKRIALFVQKLLGGSQNFEIWSRDLGHAHLGVVLWSKRSRGPSSMFLPNLKHIALFFQNLLGGSQNFEIWSRDLGHAH